MSYQTSWQGSDVQITFEGRVVFDDILEADNLLYGDPRFDTMKYTLFDLIKVEKFDVSKREAEEIAALDSASSVWNNKIKVAIVARELRSCRHIIRLTGTEARPPYLKKTRLPRVETL
ncbi:MAG: hypothetical protein QNK35_14210 [Bacteroides sp.]|nr:hypothetical protein [Bacteroides sp.]